jgi:hypothetical protein
MNDIKFVYASKDATQLDFEGKPSRDKKFFPVGSYHIEHRGSILCGTDRNKMKRRHDAKRISTTQTRPNIPMCEVCGEKYKTNGELPWSKWVQA